MAKLTVGQRVKFRRSHDKSTELTGRITAISEDNPNDVTIETEPDGKAIEVSGSESAHAADCTAIEDEAADEEEPAAPLTEHQLKFLASKNYNAEEAAKMVAGLNPRQLAKFKADAKAWKEPHSRAA